MKLAVLLLIIFLGVLMIPGKSDSYIPQRVQSVSEVFTSSHIGSIPEDKKVVLFATGDVIPARSVNMQTVTRNDFTWPFQKTADVLKSADITFINLETSFIPDCPITIEGFMFCGEDKNVEGLIYGGVDIASIANNHAGNYGMEGITATKKLLEGKSIQVTGSDGPVYRTTKGTTFAFLGYNDIGGEQQGISWADDEKVSQEIKDAKNHADIIVVAFHWGDEYTDTPNMRQKTLGHLAIDSGADVVIGNHPHWIQGVELYKGKLIAYAHGNFVFDQEWSLKTKQGVVGKYTFYNKVLVDVEYLPVQIDNYGQPSFLTGSAKNAILKNMYEISINNQ